MLFQSHFPANFLALAIFRNVKIFFENTIYVLKEKRKFRTFWEILQIQSHSKANLQPLAIFKKSMFFSEEPNYFSKKTQISKILRNPFFPVAFYRKFASFSEFKKFKFFFERHIFLKKTQNFNFESFENSCYSSRNLRQFF